METSRIADQLRKSMHGEAWHGPSVTELLAGVTCQQAAAKPIAGAHSIWELVLHITAWSDIGRRRMLGETVHPSDAEDWPGIGEATEAVWHSALADLTRTQERLAGLIETMKDEQLLAACPGKPYNLYFLLHGVIQHNLYHAGQIALLKKM